MRMTTSFHDFRLARRGRVSIPVVVRTIAHPYIHLNPRFNQKLSNFGAGFWDSISFFSKVKEG